MLECKYCLNSIWNKRAKIWDCNLDIGKLELCPNIIEDTSDTCDIEYPIVDDCGYDK